MRRRFVFKQTMARVGSKHIGGNGKSRCWFVVPVSCAFFIVASCTFLISTLVYPKHSEMSVAVVEKPISLPSNDSVIEEPVDLPANDSTPSKIASSMSTDSPLPTVDKCSGRYVYVHVLPRRFNSDMIRGCSTLNRWTEIRWMDVCAFTTNAGLGPRLDKDGGVFAGTGWYATNQFALEVIFHNRMKQYECQTTNSSLASAIFVPYYAGLDIARYLWGYEASVRDATSRDLIRWLKSRPEWSAMGGRDHFMVAGRITWDFRRATDVNSASPDWGNKLLLLPEVKNMSVLVIEASPWNSNDFGVPYPTYFHPSKDNDVHMWQNRMRRMKRPGLFSFAGAPRPDQPASIRNAIIDQCKRSQLCRLLECGIGHSKCHSPGSVMRMFERSTFCLQPPGDSYTRRSSFDSMMAGCVPVFFHPGSAYVQYTWHLPRNYSRYSVFIPENKVREGTVRIEEVLKRYKKNEVKAMREEVIRMIPRLIYADPRARLERTRDAFDLAVDGVIERVRGIKAGKVPVFKEKENWKNAIVGSGKEYEWDHFFNNRM